MITIYSPYDKMCSTKSSRKEPTIVNVHEQKCLLRIYV